MSNELVPYSDIEKMGKAVATSGLFGVKTEAQAVALMLIAQAYGQHPAIAAMEYHIIAGKPSKKSEAMLASFIQAGGKVQWHKLDDKVADATFSHTQGGELRISWTIEMAEKAGLLSKDGTLYKKYPRAMLRSRLIAEGVRTIYPAATGGMLAKEEIEDIEVNTNEGTKSRLETIIDTTATETEVIANKPKIDAQKSETKKKKEKEPDNPIKSVSGLIEEAPTSAMIDRNGTPTMKYSFKIGDKKYGTFDTALVKGIMSCVDQRILVKFGYTERISPKGALLNDIVNFEQGSADDIPIDEIK